MQRKLIFHLLFGILQLPVCYAIDSTISADTSLGTFVSKSRNTYFIQDGTLANTNLFHSFSQFDLGSGDKALFKASSSLTNIFARVTGGIASNIDGTLQVENSANLFFMNPHGMVFHENAKLDFNGSFFATTADYIKSSQGDTFYANPVHDTASSFFVADARDFGFLSSASGSPNGGLSVIDNASGLSVNTGQHLSLSADTLTLQNTTIEAPDSHISLISAPASHEIPISPSVNDTFSDTFLSNAGHVHISHDSVIQVDSISSSTAGSIVIRGGVITLDQSDLSTTKSSFNVASAGNIDIQGKSVHVSNGAQINASGTGSVTAGNISINALEKITIEGAKDTGFSSSPSSVLTKNSGANDSGNISLTAPAIDILDSAQISTSSVGFGNAGEIDINTDFLKVYGNTSSSSKILASTSFLGKGGEINIQGSDGSGSSTLVSLINGEINSTTTLFGNGGNISINAQQLNLQQNSIITTATTFVGGGNGGDISLTSSLISLSGNSKITAESLGTGDAGTITIKTANLLLDASQIALSSSLSDGGNITIEGNSPSKLVSLSNNSAITASVGGGASTTGGSISIDSDFIVLNNSQVLTEAFLGNGGNIQITSQGLFADSQSNISASSQLGVDGIVDIDSVVEVIDNALSLPDAYAPAIKINQQPCASRAGSHAVSRFVISEKSGMPFSPENMLTANFSEQNLPDALHLITQQPQFASHKPLMRECQKQAS